ncbi:hypothetical protein AB0F42_30135 [Streptomyces buecherae]|uniref:hypothetical protein n=1 Tax=Streptomyces buecherae TaxID=2763006 RepID=UPI0033D44B19
MTVISAIAAGAVAVAGVGAAQAVDAVSGDSAHPTVSQSMARNTSAADALADALDLESLGTDEEILAGIEEALSVVSRIPDDVLSQGDEATQAWVQQQLDATGDNVPGVRAFNAAKCAAGILQAIGSNVFAVAKIWKIKKAIDKLGGVKKIVQKIRGKKKKGKKFKDAIREVFEDAGSSVGAIAVGFFGVDNVQKHCW